MNGSRKLNLDTEELDELLEPNTDSTGSVSEWSGGG